MQSLNWHNAGIVGCQPVPSWHERDWGIWPQGSRVRHAPVFQAFWLLLGISRLFARERRLDWLTLTLSTSPRPEPLTVLLNEQGINMQTRVCNSECARVDAATTGSYAPSHGATYGDCGCRRVWRQARSALLLTAVIAWTPAFGEVPPTPRLECTEPTCASGDGSILDSVDYDPSVTCDEWPCQEPTDEDGNPICVCGGDPCGSSASEAYDTYLRIPDGPGVGSDDGTDQSLDGGCIYAGEVYLFIASGGVDYDSCPGEPDDATDQVDVGALAVSGGAVNYSTNCRCQRVSYVRVDATGTSLTVSSSFADLGCTQDDLDPILTLDFDVVPRKPTIKVKQPLCNEDEEGFTVVSVRSKLEHSAGAPAVTWELRENEEKCEVIELAREKEDPTDDCDRWYIYSAQIVPGAEAGDGKVKVYAKTAAGGCDEVPAEICCRDCEGTDCGPGSESAANNSVDFAINLGRNAEGDSVGQLRIHGSTPSADLSSPRGLRYDFEHSDVTVYETDGVIVGIDAPEVEVDIIDGTPDDGLYSIEIATVGTSTPLIVYEIEDISTGGGHDTLMITKEVNSAITTSYTYLYNEETDGSSWTLDQDDASEDTIRTETMRWQVVDPSSPSTSDWRRIRTVTHPEDGTGDYYKVSETYTRFTWGIALTERKVDPDGDSLVTKYGYSDSEPHVVQYVENEADGSWRYYTHYSSGAREGRLRSVISAWGDYAPADLSAVTDPDSLQAYSRELFYEYHATDLNEHRPVRITESIQGTAVVRTEYTYDEDTSGKPTVLEQRCIKPIAGTLQFLDTTTTYELGDGDWEPRGRVLLIEHPDGRREAYSYVDDGWYEPNGGQPGVFTTDPPTDPTGWESGCTQTTITYGSVSNPDGIANKSTRELRVTDRAGRTLLEETYVFTGTTYDRIAWIAYVRDARGRITNVYYSNNTEEAKSWDCCGLDWATSRHGIKTYYTVDLLGRVTVQVKEGVGGASDPFYQGDITTSIVPTLTTSPARRVVTTTVSGDGTPSLTTTTKHDLAGRLRYVADSAGLATEHTYGTSTTSVGGYSGGGRKITIDRPGGPTSGEDEITEYYRDGRIKCVYGATVVSRAYLYGVTAGYQWTKELSGTNQPEADESTAPRWTKTTHDGLGRVVMVERKAFDTSDPTHTIATHYSYEDTSGDPTVRLQNIQTFDDATPLRAPTAYTYDELGNTIASGLDLDGGGLTAGGTDRFSETESDYVQLSGDWWRETTTQTYHTDSDSTATTTGISRERLTGFGANVIGEAATEDVYENVTLATTTLDRANKLVTETTDYPATSNNAVKTTRNGLITSTTARDQLTTTVEYDGLGRRTKMTDARGVWSETHYDTAGRVDSIETPLSETTTTTTEYDYYVSTDRDAGRLKSVTNGLSNATYYDYNDRGQITHVWGDVPQPAKIEYDDYGQKVKLHTYRSGDDNVWATSSWPASEPTSDETAWAFHPPTGLLQTKTFADTNAITYAYTLDGMPEQRTWARGPSAVTTTYDYDDGSTGSGDLEQISYSDSTPQVTFTYTRSGRLYTVNDAVGARTIELDDQDKWRDETFDSDSTYGNLKTRHTYNETFLHFIDNMNTETVHFRRLTKIAAGTADDVDAYYAAEYRYDHGPERLEYVKGPGLPSSGAKYAYLTDSALVKRVNYLAGSTTKGRVVRNYEPYRDVLTSIVNKWGSPLVDVSKYEYGRDELGRREFEARGGSAFSAQHFDDWEYNARNELTDSLRRLGNPDNPGVPKPTKNRQYDYDPIGNRYTYTEGGGSTLYYCTNELNQYESTDDMHDCPSPTETFSHDEDGNLATNGTFRYSWDAENRLIKVEPVAGSPSTGDQKLEFQYDYMGRRVEKKVYLYDSGWTVIDCRRFVYHHWLPVLELNVDDADGVSPTITVFRKYTWGLDLSGNSLDGAGGIGGLLAAYDTQTTTSTADDKSYIYLYDANGNVAQLLDLSNGSFAARYVYDAYGNVIGPDTDGDGDWRDDADDYALDNPFRFSTKYWDDELDNPDTLAGDALGYWGYRYYSPRLGRWISRDPMGELGGAHLYSSVGNRPTTAIDPRGLTPTEVESFAPLRELAALWRAQGFNFSARLMTIFLYGSSRRPVPEQDLSEYSNVIASSYRYQAELARHVALVLPRRQIRKTERIRLADKYPVPGNKAFSVEFAGLFDWNHLAPRGSGTDLTWALGTGHFGYRNAILELVPEATHEGDCAIMAWFIGDMTQRDRFTFPRSRFREVYDDYRAAANLQHVHGYTPFWHHEDWHERRGFRCYRSNARSWVCSYASVAVPPNAPGPVRP